MSASLSEGGQGNCTLVQISAQYDGSTLSAGLVAAALRDDGFDVTVAFGHDGPAIQSFRDAGHETVVVPHKNWLRTTSLPRAARNVLHEWQNSAAFMRLCRQRRTRLVYVNTGASAAGAWAARRLRLPLVWHVRELHSDLGGELVSPRWLRPFFRSLMRRTGASFVANSEAVSRDLLPVDRLHAVIYNCLGAEYSQDLPDRLEARRALGLPVDGFVILVPGTIRPVKGQLEWLRAMQSSLPERPSLHIAFTGSTESAYAREVVEFTKHLPEPGRFHFLGVQSEMRRCYAAADGAIVPSVSETFGRVAVEALACGLPTLARPVGGMAGVLSGRELARLIELHEPAASLNGLRWIESQVSRPAEARESARRSVLRDFGPEIHAAKVVGAARAALTGNS